MKKNRFIIVISLVLTLTFCMALAPQAAVADNQIMPLWDNISTIELGMSFLDGNGNVGAVARKQSTATFIEATLEVYKYENNDWVFIDDWYNSVTKGTLAISADFVCESGVTYKAVFTVTAYAGSVAETETVEYEKTCPSN